MGKGIGPGREIRNYRKKKDKIEGDFEALLNEDIQQLKPKFKKFLQKSIFKKEKKVINYFVPTHERPYSRSVKEIYYLMVSYSENGSKTLQECSNVILEKLGYNKQQRSKEDIVKMGFKLTVAFIQYSNMLYFHTTSTPSSDKKSKQLLDSRYSFESINIRPAHIKQIGITIPLKNKPKAKNIRTLEAGGKERLFSVDKNRHSHKVYDCATRLEQVEYELNEDVKMWLIENWQEKQPKDDSSEMNNWRTIHNIINHLPLLSDTFYLQTYYDSRGRIYYSSFINPQQSGYATKPCTIS